MGATMRPRAAETLKQDAEYAYHLNTLKNFNQLLIYQGGILKKEMQETYSSIE